MRELSHALASIAKMRAPPTGNTKSSGAARKKFATVKAAVGHFVGPDVVRALLANDEYNTASNLCQLQFLITCAGCEASRTELEAEIELLEAQSEELIKAKAASWCVPHSGR